MNDTWVMGLNRILLIFVGSNNQKRPFLRVLKIVAGSGFLRIMSKDPESVPFVRRVLQISQTDERWFLLARHATIPQRDDVVDRWAYSSPLM